jgi:hypothetical protein
MARLVKARHASECLTLEALPNIGHSLAADLRRIGIQQPADLEGADAVALYQALRRATGHAQDPCVLDTFLAIVDFMGGAPPTPWWHYTRGRKRPDGNLTGAVDPAAAVIKAAGSSGPLPAALPDPTPAGIARRPRLARSPGSAATTECRTARSSA